MTTVSPTVNGSKVNYYIPGVEQTIVLDTKSPMMQELNQGLALIKSSAKSEGWSEEKTIFEVHKKVHEVYGEFDQKLGQMIDQGASGEKIQSYLESRDGKSDNKFEIGKMQKGQLNCGEFACLESYSLNQVGIKNAVIEGSNTQSSEEAGHLFIATNKGVVESTFPGNEDPFMRADNAYGRLARGESVVVYDPTTNQPAQCYANKAYDQNIVDRNKNTLEKAKNEPITGPQVTTRSERLELTKEFYQGTGSFDFNSNQINVDKFESTYRGLKDVADGVNSPEAQKIMTNNAFKTLSSTKGVEGWDEKKQAEAVMNDMKNGFTSPQIKQRLEEIDKENKPSAQLNISEETARLAKIHAQKAIPGGELGQNIRDGSDVSYNDPNSQSPSRQAGASLLA